MQAQAEAETAKTEFAHQVYNDELEKQYVGVVCPSCGASGNKIRLGTVGYCQYCGTAIKAVGAEGSVAQAADPAAKRCRCRAAAAGTGSGGSSGTG